MSDTEIPFRGTTIKVGAYIAARQDFRTQIALLEVLGLSYLNALQRQGIDLDNDGQIRKILEEEEKDNG